MGVNPPSSSSRYALTFLLILGIIEAGFAEERSIYLVLMEGDPVAFHQGVAPLEEGKKVAYNTESSKAHAKHLVESHDQLLESKLELGSYKKLYSFSHIVNGFAIHTTQSQANILKSAQGVKLLEKDRGAKLMTTYTPRFLGLPNGVWEVGGERNAGDGITIGFVDTGINPIHPSFAFDPEDPFHFDPQHFSGACEAGPRFPASSCNGKIVSARYFSAGAAATAPLNGSKDFLSPFDASGHGSHVASVAAGNYDVPVVIDGFEYGRASGMAPRAQIAVYKAIYPDIGTIADVVSAIDQAASDGVDIITLAIGPNEPPEDTLTFLNIFDIFLLFARRAGIFVVQAAGNKGPGAASVVSFSPWAMGVGACTTDRIYSGSLLLGDGRKLPGVGLSGSTLGKGVLKFKLILAKDAIKANGSYPSTPPYIEECQHPEAFDPAVVQGSVVICTFSTGFLNGTSTLLAIFDTAKFLGFAGFVLGANPLYGDFVANPIPFPLSGIMIPKIAHVKILLEYYEAQTYRDSRGVAIRYGGQVAIEEGREAAYLERAPVVSGFSSRGPDIIDNRLNPADVLKPDIIAPGHVWGAWTPISVLDQILSGYDFALLSGTSMATPHVAGIGALIKQAHPSWTPSMIASAISTTASNYDNHGEPMMAQGADFSTLHPSTPFDHGAGLINPARAMDPGLVFPSGFEDYVSFLCSIPNLDPSTVKATTGTSCNLPLSSPSDLNLPSITISSLLGSQSLRRNVVNVATKSETYLCSMLQPSGVEVSLYPPWFTIAPQGTQDLEIKLIVREPSNDFVFGVIVLTGSLDHIVRLPLAVFPISVSR